MKDTNSAAGSTPQLLRHLSPLAVWALAFGCAVGWGAFIMPGTTFLPIAGPVGTAIGIAVGAFVMFVIGVNYHFLMNRYPDAGGTFSYTKHVFGYDHAFLSSWFMGLVYLAIIWANCTALPLIFRKLFGDVLQKGYLYTIAGYEVYIGEVLLSLAALVLFGVVCMRGGKLASGVMIVTSLVLIAGILIALCYIIIRPDTSTSLSFEPAFSPEHSALGGSLFIVFLAPWAFAGFESVSQSAEEFKFPVKKSLVIMTAALVTAAAAYIILNFVAASAVPAGYTSWVDYTKDLDNLSGYQSVPTMNGLFSAVGKPGLWILGIAAAAGIITGLLGNTVAASRLICSISRDDVISEKIGSINKYGVPQKAVLFLILISLPIPFLGRSATGWVIDINTIGVTIAYAYTSAAAFRVALREKRTLVRITGAIGILTSLFFLIYFLIPNEWAKSSGAKLGTVSYLMLLVWLLGGFVVFFLIFRRDKARRFGQSTVVWLVLLVLIFSTSVIWVRETTTADTEKAIAEYLDPEEGESELERIGVSLTQEKTNEAKQTLEAHFDSVSNKIIRNSVVISVIIITAMVLVFNIYRIVQKSHNTAVEDKTIAEQSSSAKTTFLSNMSHDIRTPMNAIVGYVALAKREKDLPPAVGEYLSKIEASSDHLLALINDVLEMSRIESGKMELAPVPTDLRRMMEDVKNLFSTQMETKGLEYTVECRDLADANVLCDANRFNRVLLNLVSNAYKFTPEGGSVTVTLDQTGREEDCASYRIRVKDTGIGMSAEFAAKVFEAYERERTTTVENIQGTGLGTAITKSIVDLMGGTIEVFSEKGKGSEFVINISFPLDPDAKKDNAEGFSQGDAESAFAGMRVLLVEDDPDNRDIAEAMLEQLGFTVDCVVNGEDAAEAIAASAPGKYSAAIMDIEMPVKNGYEATKLIRSLRSDDRANIPIVALSAKAFSEDIAAAREAGMNAYIAKPINYETLKKTMSDVLL